MRIKFKEAFDKNNLETIIKPGFEILTIATSGTVNYNNFKSEYNFPIHNQYDYFPTIKVANSSKIINKRKIYEKRYNQALCCGIITNDISLSEFVEDPLKRIGKGRPNNNNNVIIFDDYHETGRTLDLCIKELLSIGYNINKLFFTVGTYDPLVYSLRESKR